jgi:HSP20 family protein
MTRFRSWSPFRDLDDFKRGLDEILENLRSKTQWPFEGGTAAFKPPLESFVEEGNLLVRTDLPGIDPKDITVSMRGDVLTIRARREEEHETKKRNFLHREFKYGAIERLVNLPRGVRTEEVKASFTNGLLELKIPMSEEGTPKEVKIEVGGTESKPTSGNAT